MSQTHSRQTRDAAATLGALIAAGRRERRWTAAEFAARVGVSRPTIAKVEAGDLGVAVGTVLEAAVLAGVPLFADTPNGRAQVAHQARLHLALLPARIRHPDPDSVVIDDDF